MSRRVALLLVAGCLPIAVGCRRDSPGGQGALEPRAAAAQPAMPEPAPATAWEMPLVSEFVDLWPEGRIVVLFGGDEDVPALIGLDAATGEERWRSPVAEAADCWAEGAECCCGVQEPLRRGHVTVLFPQEGALAAAVDLRSGGRLWSADLPGSGVDATWIGDDRIAVVVAPPRSWEDDPPEGAPVRPPNRVVLLDAGTGGILWTTEPFEPPLWTIVGAAGHLVAFRNLDDEAGVEFDAQVVDLQDGSQGTPRPLRNLRGQPISAGRWIVAETEEDLASASGQDAWLALAIPSLETAWERSTTGTEKLLTDRALVTLDDAGVLKLQPWDPEAEPAALPIDTVLPAAGGGLLVVDAGDAILLGATDGSTLALLDAHTLEPRHVFTGIGEAGRTAYCLAAGGGIALFTDRDRLFAVELP